MPAPHTTGAPIKKSTLELVVPQFVPFETRLDPDAPPVVLHGRLRIRLRRETTFKNAVVDCRGALTIMPVKTAAWKPDSRIVYLSSVSLLGPGPTTLAAGVHEYPFAMTLSPDMPCSLPDAGGMARVVYTLRARATKTKTGVLRKAVAKVGGLVMPWRGALECERPVDLARAYPRESIEFQNVHEAEGQWKNKALYSVALPHRAWAAGDTIMVLVKLVPLAKDRIPVQLRLSLREDVRIVTSGGPRTFTRHVSSVAIPVTFTPPPSPAAAADTDERPGADEAGPSTLRADITPYEENQENDVTVTASDPGPFELPIPAKTLPTYRNALITVRHHIDFLVQFAAPDASSPLSPSTTNTNTTATSPGTTTPGSPRAKFHPESCRVSMGLRILSHHLLPSARVATLENRTALFGPLPALMLLSERDNTLSEDEGAAGEEGGTGLPSYADHVADAIPQLIPLMDPGRLALGMGGLGFGMGAGLDTVTGLSTIGGGGGDAIGTLGLHRLNSASVLALGSIAADLEYDLDAEEVRELGLAQTGRGQLPSVLVNGRSAGSSVESGHRTRNTTRTAGTDAQQARRLALMSRVPDYGAAVSVGGTAGIVPLSSSRELPSYADSQAQSREGSVRRGPLARVRAIEESRVTV